MITRDKRIGFGCVPKQILKSRQLFKADDLLNEKEKATFRPPSPYRSRMGPVVNGLIPVAK